LETKDDSQYWRNRANPGGVASYCIPCEKQLKALRLSSNPERQREYQRRYHLRHHEKRLAANKVFAARPQAILLRQVRHDRNAALMLLEKARGCVDCGERDPIVLDFDHVRGEKRENIARMYNWNTESVRVELAKCEVRCANCHRRMTAKRGRGKKTA
jgi:hypothetical protein